MWLETNVFSIDAPTIVSHVTRLCKKRSSNNSHRFRITPHKDITLLFVLSFVAGNCRPWNMLTVDAFPSYLQSLLSRITATHMKLPQHTLSALAFLRGAFDIEKKTYDLFSFLRDTQRACIRTELFHHNWLTIKANFA